MTKDWRERARSTEEMYGEVFGVVSQVPGPARLPAARPAAPERRPIRRRARPAERGRRRRAARRRREAVVGAGWQSGKFLYVDTDLKIDLPAGARRHRPRAARRPRPRSRRRRAGARDAARRRLRQPVQLLRSQLQGHPADRRRGPRDRRARSSTSRSRRPGGQLVPVSTFIALESSTAPRTPQPVPAAQRRPRLRRRQSRRHEGRGPPRARERRCREGRRAGVVLDYAGESRQIRREGSALTVTLGFAVVLIYLVLAAQFKSFRDPLIVLARIGAARDLRRARVQLPRPDDDQHLLPGRADHARRPDREERHPHRPVRQHAAERREWPSPRRSARPRSRGSGRS